MSVPALADGDIAARIVAEGSCIDEEDTIAPVAIGEVRVRTDHHGSLVFSRVGEREALLAGLHVEDRLAESLEEHRYALRRSAESLDELI